MSRPPALTSTHPYAQARTSDLGLPSSSGGDRAQLAQLAAEFESMLMLEMIKQMRQSLLGEETQGDGLGAETFASTIDTELSRHLSRAGGLGLQGAMLDAWDRQQGGSNSTTAPAAAATPVPVRALASPSVAVSTARSVSRPPATPVPAVHDAHEPPLALEMHGRVSSSYGWRRDPFQGTSRFHGGIDLAARYGTEVPAAAGGTVIKAGEQGAYGLTVVVRHAGGYESRYAHLSSLDVREGDTVERGARVGRVGSTGRSTAPHLHFEVTRSGKRIDPDRFVRNLTSDIKGQ